MLECVANISEGRDTVVLRALGAVVADVLLDVHTDADHHRSVFTMAGGDDEIVDAAMALCRRALDLIDLRSHAGVHPRLGAVDVVPFVALESDGRPARSPHAQERAIAAARRFCERIGAEAGIPAFLYDLADPLGRSLPSIRRDAFTTTTTTTTAREPDAGPSRPHPTFGAVAVGARPPLAAVNFVLAGSLAADARRLADARAIARAVRERDGGLPGVRALGVALASLDRAQVSMNLVDLDATGLEAVYGAVESRARALGTSVEDMELVGLVPRDAWLATTPAFRARWLPGAEPTIEAVVASQLSAGHPGSGVSR